MLLEQFTLLLVIIAMVLGSVLTAFLFSFLADLFTTWRRGGEEQEVDHGVLSRKANLWGLRLNEREKVLDAVFAKTRFQWHVSPVAPPQADTEDDQIEEIELGMIKDAKDDKKLGDYDDAKINLEKVTNRESTEGKKVSITVKHEGGDDLEDEEDDDMASVDDAEHERLCCICLASYEDGDTCMTGTRCEHRFHAKCCREWLLQHDHCPYCRKEMMLASELRQAACLVLGEPRVLSMSILPPRDATRTTTPMPPVVATITASTLVAPSTTTQREEPAPPPEAAVTLETGTEDVTAEALEVEQEDDSESIHETTTEQADDFEAASV